MKRILLLDSAGNAVVRNGKLVLVNEDKTEIEVDPVNLYDTNGRLFGEAKEHREKRAEAETTLQKFAGITDPKAALDALNKVATLGTKEAELAGKIEEVRTETRKALELQYAPVVEKAKTLEGELTGIRRRSAFGESKFVKDKLNIPADIAEATFGRNFKEEGGKLVPVDARGQPIYSLKNPGNPADFEEGIELFVGQYANRDAILKGSGASGGGTHPNNGGGGGGGAKVMKRAEFLALPAGEQATAIKTVQVVD